MKQFFKMMFASALGVFVALGIVFFIFVFTLISMVGSVGMESVYSPTLNTVYKISLNGTITDSETPENPFAMFMGETQKPLSLKTLLESIQKAKENNNINGIYLEAGSLSTGTANRQAIRRALIDFKESGKFVVAYADNYTQGNYYLCSVADKVFLNPQGMLLLPGMASQTMFYKGLMDKIGFNFEIFKVGTYKGAVEPFMLDKLSDANREQINSYLTSIWDNITDGIAEGRNISIQDVNRFANEGLFLNEPQKAIEYGLVDELMYKKQAEEYVKELAGQSGKRLKTAGTDKIKNIKSRKKSKGDQIAILYAEGEIKDEIATSPYDMEAYISEKVVDEIAKLKDNDDIKAVVMRVNSPGGSAYLSEQIWEQIIELKKTKPVVVSMGSMAASGGYYISCGADKIIAEPTTLTGSIGIFGMFPNLTGTYKKLGLTTDIVKTNTYADLGDVSRPLREDEKELIQGRIERGYDLFISRCASGRGMTKEQINEIGQGRVWTGEQAIQIGLVDELGGLDTAIEVAANLAGIYDYQTIDVAGRKDFWSDFLQTQIDEVKLSLVKSTLGTDYEYVKILHTMRSSHGIQARIPYDMKAL